MTDRTTLYRFFDQDGTLLYIGIAGNPGRRWEQHADSKTWWDTVATTTCEHFATRKEAADAERRAIETEHPAHNIIHNRAKTGRTTAGRIHEIGWRCDVCRGFISNGDGYLEKPKGTAQWDVLHRGCDPHVHGSSYWIGVERIRKVGDLGHSPDTLFGWVTHLSEKRWFDLNEFTHRIDLSASFETKGQTIMVLWGLAIETTVAS